MDTFLTLVIAFGGIATGIGAIWAALTARRQAQVTERHAQITEQSLAEQNERARLTLEYDLLTSPDKTEIAAMRRSAEDRLVELARESARLYDINDALLEALERAVSGMISTQLSKP